MHTMFGFPTVRNDVKLARLLVSESETHYRISIAVFNRLPREELVRTVKLRTDCPHSTDPSVNQPKVYYQIMQDFKFDTVPGVALSGVVHDEEPEYRSRVFGDVADNTGCGTLFRLWFNTSTPLPSNQHVTVVVDVPKKITVRDDPVPVAQDGQAFTEPTTMELPIGLRRDRTFVVTLVVADVEISGSPD